MTRCLQVAPMPSRQPPVLGVTGACRLHVSLSEHL